MSTEWPSVFDAFRHVHPAETLAELTVLTPKDVGRNYLLHISKNKDLDIMIPYICTRAASDEDRSIPRVCVSPSIAACLVGYDSTIEEWMEGQTAKDGFGQNDIPWCGGWYIYAIPFEYVLKPSPELLKAVTRTDEMWLVNYNPKTWAYRPRKVGKLFYTAVSHKSEEGGKVLRVDMCLELTQPGIRVPFCKGLNLEPGYYHIRSDKLLNMATMDEVCLDGMMPLSEEEYRAIKMPVAALLSFAEHGVKPEHVPSLNW
jgi:hypothetical protein